ncbi:flavonol sulfotransferase-like [Pistacia vera]|uniref:flavonol sulfotransferase-like n=1 Tax=Pistacia vera TaxID=55513 RepID=UPI001263C076|nr:flavonol sulfotransferase-like [Pistacia vera]
MCSTVLHHPMESSFPSEKSSHLFKSSKENQDFSKTPTSFKDLISTLPKDNGWKFCQPLYLYQGFWYNPFVLEGTILAQKNFQAQPGDIFLCNAPKTGTSWLKALTFAIATRNHFDLSSNPLLTKLPHDCVPSLEMDYFKNPTMPKPAGGLSVWATHISFSSLPKSITESKCKVIYICRDPKDTFVSLWHYLNKMRSKSHEEISLEEAFELFCNGKSPYGPYWDHVLEYWKASLECPNQFYFLKYEDMKKDTIFHLKKIAEFVGHPFSLEEEREGVVNKIMELCSFENLSNLDINKKGQSPHADVDGGTVDNNLYFRKGKVGDWKNFLTFEMGERMDNIMETKLSGSGLNLKA